MECIAAAMSYNTRLKELVLQSESFGFVVEMNK